MPGNPDSGPVSTFSVHVSLVNEDKLTPLRSCFQCNDCKNQVAHTAFCSSQIFIILAFAEYNRLPLLYLWRKYLSHRVAQNDSFFCEPTEKVTQRVDPACNRFFVHASALL